MSRQDLTHKWQQGNNKGKQAQRARKETQYVKLLTPDNIGNGHPGDHDEPQASCGDGGARERAEKPVTPGS